MEMHTTNYFNTLIEVAQDTKATTGVPPPAKKEKKTIAEMQYDLIANHPYKFTSDEVLFRIFAERKELDKAEYEDARAQFFSRGQACLRTSPLAKTHGYGIHSDNEGRVALYGMETAAYGSLQSDDTIKKVKAMRSSRK